VWQQIIGEMGKFIIFWCQVSSGCRLPKIIKICWFLGVIQKKIKRWQRGHF